MGRASSSKKVSRAASTGGGRTARGAKPWLWYAVMGLVVALGVAGIVTSRQERRSELASGESLTPPAVGRDHWHAAYGIYLTLEQGTKHRRFCSWCLAAAGASLATVPQVVPEAAAAWKALRRRR
ncbi:MAG: hypothetical protein KY439_11355 [Actinobacteria bacterium]|nr:hypothetical protein [Actinomycetota bacterium]